MAALSSTHRVQNLNARRVVVGSRKVSRLGNLLFGATMSLLFVILLAYFHTVLLEHHANKTQQSIIQTSENNAKLAAELAELQTLSVIEGRALEMGMRPMDQFQYIALPQATYAQAENLPLKELSVQKEKSLSSIGF